jgi:hypothetical protein
MMSTNIERPSIYRSHIVLPIKKIMVGNKLPTIRF